MLHVINLYHLSNLMMIDRRYQCICIFHLCPGLQAEAKIAIFHVLQKIASLTIFCVSFFVLQFFVMLIITEVQSELSISQNLQKLRKIVSLTIFVLLAIFRSYLSC